MGVLLFILTVVQGTDCAEWRECRDAALEAVGRGDYEAFHDLAWRAVQKGPPRDPDLMYLVARAQSLSGRPADALVMLRRLAEMGVATDASSSEDFERVRALPGWADVAALGASGEPARTSDSAPPSPARPAPGKEEAPASAPMADGDAVRFDAISFIAAGLAYDAVSRRFVVGDRDARKLFVVDEGSQRANDLVGAASAGFHAIAGLDIDSRRGDLWVVSGEEGQPGAAAVHKLQLVSGRLIETLTVPLELLPVRFADVAVTADGAVLALDAAGRRIFRARFGSHALEVAAALDVNEPTSLTTAPGTAVYVSHAAGLIRVDLASHTVSAVSSQEPSVELSGLERIRSRDGSLVAVQRVDAATRRVVRLALNGRGRRILSAQILAASAPASAGTAATLAGDVFYYVAIGPSREATVRRIALR